MVNELLGFLHDLNLTFSSSPVSVSALSNILQLLNSGSVSALNAKKVLERLCNGDTRAPAEIVRSEGWELLQMKEEELERNCSALIEQFPNEVCPHTWLS